MLLQKCYFPKEILQQNRAFLLFGLAAGVGAIRIFTQVPLGRASLLTSWLNTWGRQHTLLPFCIPSCVKELLQRMQASSVLL